MRDEVNRYAMRRDRWSVMDVETEMRCATTSELVGDGEVQVWRKGEGRRRWMSGCDREVAKGQVEVGRPEKSGGWSWK